MKVHWKITIPIFCIFLMTLLLQVKSAKAEFSSLPNGNTYVTNGQVLAIVPTSSIVYIGGVFTYVGPYTGNGVPIATSNGAATTTFPKVNSTIRAVVSDHLGGWYIGGAFTQIGAATYNRLAHVLPNGTIDTNFNPNLNGDVYSLTLSADGTTLYAGGIFTQVGGVSHARIAKITTSSGSFVSAFAPGTPNNDVYAIALSPDEATLYVGGLFINISGTTRNRLAAVATSNGALTSFDPNLSNYVRALALSSSGAILYVGGNFTTVAGVTYGQLAAITTATGAAVATFTPTANNEVDSLALSSDGNTLYAGGTFTLLGGSARNRLGAVLTSNGTAVAAFNPSVNTDVNSLALSSNGLTLYLGGLFTTVGGTSRNRIASVLTVDGSLVSTFNPNADNDVKALAFSADGSLIYAGGTFISVGGGTYNRLAAINASTGAVITTFNPNLDNDVRALAISPDEATLYVGGLFTTIGGVTYNRLAAITTSTGAAVSAFNPNANSNVYSLAVSSDGTTLYAGGGFSQIGLTVRNRLASMLTSNGSLVSAFNPNGNNDVNSLALSSDNSTIYAGGAFTTIGGSTRNGLAAITTSNGVAVSAFNPNVTGNVLALSLSSNGSIIYAGGVITLIGGVTYYDFAAIATSNGAANAAVKPVIQIGGDVRDIALSSDGGTAYIAGIFTTIDGLVFNRLAGINTTNGTTTTFNPNANAGLNALATSPNGNTLYAGGIFTAIGGLSQYEYFTSFPLSISAPSVTTSAATSVATSTVTLNGSITATGGGDATQSGFAYGTSPTLATTIATSTLGAQTGTASFLQNVSGLSPNTTYYFRAYATNGGGTGYGTILTFTTSSVSAPTVTTQAVSAIAATTATGNGNITSTGNINPTARGVTYGTTIAYGATTTEVGNFSTGAFTASITGLACNTLYHVRAYATNTQGTGYGSDVTFTTTPCSPSVTTSAATSVATSTAILNGSITATGGNDASQSGFAYGTSPTLATTIATSTLGAQTGTASFSENLTGLSPNTTYFFRAYATNSGGTGYGTIQTFTTSAIAAPTVTTQAVTSIAETTATGNGTITSTGNINPTARGVTYGTTIAYGATTTEVGNFGTGAFTASITGLVCNTLYHVRAYATNTQGTGYGSDVTFTTNACVPTVITNSASNVATSTLTLNGAITFTNGADASQSGFAYGTSPTLATVIATSTLGPQVGAASFSQNVSGLIPNTVYYFRAYATNSAGTGFGAILSTTTIPVLVPTVSTSPATGISQTDATLNGSIDSIGANTVTERGFNWGLTSSYGTSVSESGVFGTGPFSGALTGLTCGTIYHFRSYAINSAGTGASPDASFTTTACPSSGGPSGGSGGSTSIFSPPYSQPPATTTPPQGQGNPPAVTYYPPPRQETPLERFLRQLFGNEESPTPVPPSPLTPLDKASILGGNWELIPGSLIDNFVLEGLPKEFAVLFSKFPDLEQVFTDIGIIRVSDLAKLQNAKINLPIITDKNNLPTEIFIAKSADGTINIGSSINFSSQGDISQVIHLLSGQPFTLSIKPGAKVDSIKGYLVFKQKISKIVLDLPTNSMAASAILSARPLAQSSATPAKINAEMVLDTFEYTDPDGDGVYTAKLNAPQAEAEYEVITIVNYTDKNLGSKEIRMITVVDPEGYVYRKTPDGEQVRIKGVEVSIFQVLSTGPSLWNAERYSQTNPIITDETGKFSFLVPVGTYFVTAKARGYGSYRSDQIEVKEGNPVHFNIELIQQNSWWYGLLDWKMGVLLIVLAVVATHFIEKRMKKKINNISTINT